MRAVLVELDPRSNELLDLCFEVTERSVMDADADVIAQVSAIRALGVRVILDEFGTGSASFNQLRNLPVDGIKLDRTFIAGLDADQANASLARLIVDLAGMLDLAIVAEGIETPAEREAVVALGCTRGQGHLFGRPMSADAFLLTASATAPPARPDDRDSAGVG